jgi:hypothetical protein
MHGHPLVGLLCPGFPLSPRRPLGRGHDGRPLGLTRRLVVVIEQHRGQCLAQVPLDIVGQHAEKNVRTHPLGEAVADRADVEIHCFEAAKGPLDCRQTLLGVHRAGGTEQVEGDAGAEHVEAIEGGFGHNTGGVAGIEQRFVGDLKAEVLAHLEAVEDLAHPEGNLRLAGEPAFGTLRRLANGFELPLSGLQERFAFARPFLGQRGIPTRDQALRRVGGRSALKQIRLGKVRQVEGHGFHQRADRRATQRRNPIEPLHGLQLLVDPCIRQHAAIPYQDDPSQVKPVTEFLELGSECGGVGGVTSKDLHGHRAALGVTD